MDLHQYAVPILCLAIILVAGYCVYAFSQALDKAPKIRRRSYDIMDQVRARRYRKW